jgi:Kdo2-lipid IVA lauroyltransferase/acyltransferase
MYTIFKVRIKKRIKYLLEASIVYLLYWLLYIMPIDYASALAGYIASKIGPKLRVSNIAVINLRKCFPNFSEEDIEDIVFKMWNNLGRIAGEFPHWSKMSSEDYYKRVKFVKPVNKITRSGLLLSGHLGNFDLVPKAATDLTDHNLKFIYRPANNHYIDRMIRLEREKNKLIMFPKGKSGLKRILEALDSGDVIGMMIDQKMNDGLEIPFFGMPAKSTNLPAKLSIKFKLPIYIGKVTRTKGVNYKVEVEEIKIIPGENIKTISCKINNILEGWIKEQPEQWFWIHRRWMFEYRDTSVRYKGFRD